MFGKAKPVEKTATLDDEVPGLEVDNRVLEKDQSEKTLAYLSEKETRAVPLPALSTQHNYWNNELSPISPETPGQFKYIAHELDESNNRKAERKCCGLHRRIFWIICALILFTLVVAGAIIGGVAGVLSRKHTTQQSNNSSNAQLPTFPDARRADVKLDSPLAVASYSMLSGNSNASDNQQSLRMYYQSLFGNVKESIYGNSSWSTAQPILTDAVNHTGLATYAYMNGTQLTGALFYSDTWGYLVEKRKVYSDTQYWQIAGIKKDSVRMSGSLAPNTTTSDSQNTWDSYRLAAVYSQNFANGPGARLFHHAKDTNGSTFVQEMIWAQNTDQWTQGAVISGVNANAHLAATIDESTGTLKLYASTGNKSLQEFWYSLKDPNAQYVKTVRIDNILSANNAEVATVSANGSTYLYTYASPSSTSLVTGIKEYILNSSADSSADRYRLNGPMVVSPYMPNGNDASLYHPIAVALSDASQTASQLKLFWADTPTGDPRTTEPGYRSLSQMSRPVGNETWPGGKQQSIDLGSEDDDPHSA